jgi:chromosome segregation ATPase
MVSKWLLIQTKLELDRLRGELEAAQQRLDKKQKLIQSGEKAIVELKRKIKALETIDQKIQKKKDAIPSADTP